MSDAANMRKLMEAFKPTQQMEYDEYPTEELPGNEVVDTEMGEERPIGQDIIDVLENEFKRLTTEFLQAGGELDEAGLEDIRQQLGKHMASILDVLHKGWMDSMMSNGEAEGDELEGDEDADDSDADEDESEEHEEEESEAEEKEEDDDDSEEEEKEEKEEDDKEEDEDKKDDDDDDNGFPFKEAHLNESYDYSSKSVKSVASDMRKNLNKVLLATNKK